VENVRASWRRIVVVGVLAVSLAGEAFAQPNPMLTQQSVAAHLQGPFLVLRGMYDGNRLDFDAQGKLRDLAGVLPFSLSAVRVDGVAVGGKVVIVGTREGLEFTAPSVPGGRMEVSAAPWSQDARVEIRIRIDRHHPEELFATLDKIFATGLQDGLADVAPDYWQPWLRHWQHPDDPAYRLRSVIEADGGESCRGDGFTPPRLLDSMPPEFSTEARMARYEGVVVVHMTVADSGRPERIFIVRPLGMGLDDNAVNAVRQYQFMPGMKEGQPVACETNVEVSFRLGSSFQP